MWQKEMFVFFLSLALGYILCVIAKKQTSILKTVGYTFGISVIALTLLSALMMSRSSCMNKMLCGNMGKMNCPMMRHHMPMKGVN